MSLWRSIKTRLSLLKLVELGAIIRINMYQGSCLCGKVQYKLLSEPQRVSSCHCTMCQKQHGAAFATYGNLPKADLVYVAGADLLASYNSSANIERKFCKECGSSLEWCGSAEHPNWTSITLSTLDTPLNPETITQIFTETKACWLETN